MLEEEPHTDTGRTCKITQTITQGQDRSGDPGAVRLECYPMYHHATIFLFRVHVVNLLTSTNTILHVCFTLLPLNMRRDWSGRIKKRVLLEHAFSVIIVLNLFGPHIQYVMMHWGFFLCKLHCFCSLTLIFITYCCKTDLNLICWTFRPQYTITNKSCAPVTWRCEQKNI